MGDRRRRLRGPEPALVAIWLKPDSEDGKRRGRDSHSRPERQRPLSLLADSSPTRVLAANSGWQGPDGPASVVRHGVHQGVVQNGHRRIPVCRREDVPVVMNRETMRLLVDTSAVIFVVAGPPEPASISTRRSERSTRTISRSSISMCSASELVAGAVLTVKVTGEPKGIGQVTPVRFTDLVAATWPMGVRLGVSFKAAKVELGSRTKSRHSSSGEWRRTMISSTPLPCRSPGPHFTGSKQVRATAGEPVDNRHGEVQSSTTPPLAGSAVTSTWGSAFFASAWPARRSARLAATWARLR